MDLAHKVTPKVESFIPIGKRVSLALVGDDKTSLFLLRKSCKMIGIENIREFAKGKDFYSFCKGHDFTVVFGLKGINDMRWTTFVRTLRADPKMPLIPIVLFLPGREDDLVSKVERQNFDVIKSYEATLHFGVSAGLEKLIDILYRVFRDLNADNSILSRMINAKKTLQAGKAEEARKIYGEILEKNPEHLAANAGLVHTYKADAAAYREKLREILEKDQGI